MLSEKSTVHQFAVAHDNQKKAKKRIDGKTQLRNKNAYILVPIRKGTVPTSCGISSLTLCKPTISRSISILHPKNK